MLFELHTLLTEHFDGCAVVTSYRQESTDGTLVILDIECFVSQLKTLDNKLEGQWTVWFVTYEDDVSNEDESYDFQFDSSVTVEELTSLNINWADEGMNYVEFFAV